MTEVIYSAIRRAYEGKYLVHLLQLRLPGSRKILHTFGYLRSFNIFRKKL